MERINASQNEISAELVDNEKPASSENKEPVVSLFFSGFRQRNGQMYYPMPVMIFETIVKLCLLAYLLHLLFFQFNTIETISSTSLPYVNFNLPMRFAKTMPPTSSRFPF